MKIQVELQIDAEQQPDGKNSQVQEGSPSMFAPPAMPAGSRLKSMAACVQSGIGPRNPRGADSRRGAPATMQLLAGPTRQENVNIRSFLHR